MAAARVAQPETGPRAARLRITRQGVLESILLLAATAMFVYEWAESLRLRQGPELLPRIVATTGLVALVVYVGRRLWRLRRPSAPGTGTGSILDIGMEGAGLDRGVLVRRVSRFLGALAFLYVGVWLMGFHLTIPLFLVGYLRLWGEMGWRGAILTAAAYFAVMVVLYDQVLRSPWNDPVIGRFVPLISFR
jgi:hypothetical protein